MTKPAGTIGGAWPAGNGSPRSGAAGVLSDRGGTDREHLAVLGAGWVGLVTAACFAELGHRVTVRDVSEERIGELTAGRLPFYEPGLADVVERNRARLSFTLDVGEAFSEARLIFVCVGTPSTPTGDADLSGVRRVIDELPRVAEGVTLIMKSTVPVGTGAKVRAALDARGARNVGYVSNPEFLAEGSAVHDFFNPQRILIGSFDSRGAERVGELYGAIPAPIRHMDVASAEMTKYASNAFLATKISFVNEIANVCEQTGADVVTVAEAMGLDCRIGPHFLQAGIGYGGSCFPKDVAALKQLAGNSGYHFQLLTAVIEVNDLQKRRVVTRLREHLGPLAGKTVALLGLAFKPNTDDLREASSLVLASRLLAEGADVRAWDPVAIESARELLDGVELCDDVLDAVAGADAAVIVTEWEELRQLPLETVRDLMRRPLVLDGRNFLDPNEVRGAGIDYEAIGRPAVRAPVARALELQVS